MRTTIVAALRAFLFACVGLALVAAVAACSGTDTQAKDGGAGAEAPDSSEQFTSENWGSLVSDPDAHKGASVDVVGKVFVSPERDEDGIAFQMYVDPKNSEWNTIVGYADSSLEVRADDYVRVKGTVKGTFEGENAFGAELTVPVVTAELVEVVDAVEAASPAIERLPQQQKTKAGITITVEKVEFADDETRVFVFVQNDSFAQFDLYSSSGKAVQEGAQYDSTFSTDYPELSSEIVPGANTSGVMVFPKMDPDAGLDLHLEGYSADSNAGDYGSLNWLFHW